MVEAKYNGGVELDENSLNLWNTRRFLEYKEDKDSNSGADKRKVDKKRLQSKCDEYFFRQVDVLNDFRWSIRRGSQSGNWGLLKLARNAPANGELTLQDHVLDTFGMMRKAIKNGYRPFNVREDYRGFIEFYGDTKTPAFNYKLVCDV